jgi:hypothetical protein
MTDITSGAKTPHRSGAPEFTFGVYMYSRGSIVHLPKLHVFTFYVSGCDVRYGFLVKTTFVSLLQFVLSGIHVLSNSFLSIYVYWCQTRFPYQMMFVSLKSNTTDVTRC